MKIDEIKLNEKTEGKTKVIDIPIVIKVEKESFLHIGASPSPLTDKKGAIFKVDRTPVIPASSFKGALRTQLELLFIEKKEEFKSAFNLDNVEVLKPCIPAPRPSKAENDLISSGEYRDKHCEIKVDENKVTTGDFGICPVCYFMGCTGIMGFLRISNFYPEIEGNFIDQTNIRIDRKTKTAAYKAKVDGELVKPGTVFRGIIEIIDTTEQGCFEFGQAKNIDGVIIDKWLEKWNEKDNQKRKEYLLKEILFPALENIKVLGGWKSKGCGKVFVSIKGKE
jgi:CRISPR/Cas system CSM-associated protein Csm3 (group 7 of RAMP superfamily)